MKCSGKPKVTREDIAEIRRMYAIKDKRWSVPQIARSFGVSAATINKVQNVRSHP